MTTDLLLIVENAVTGLDMAYEALENKRYDEAMLHVGHFHAQLAKAAEAERQRLAEDAEKQAAIRRMSEERRKNLSAVPLHDRGIFTNAPV